MKPCSASEAWRASATPMQIARYINVAVWFYLWASDVLNPVATRVTSGLKKQRDCG
jgi:hypothetical protein